jgi:hypothetical protein
LHSIGADEEADVYGALPPQPAVAPHALGTGRRSVGRIGEIDHRFPVEKTDCWTFARASRLLSAGCRPLSL